ncbi:MAG: prephenate dehydratase [Conexivisphaerales archaeon]
MVRVSFQGELGAYSEEASINFFGNTVDLYPLPYLTDVFKSVENGLAEFAVVPIENTLEGSVNETYDLLIGASVKIIGEEVLRVKHCFMANFGVKIGDVKEVWSHPQALSQCRKFIESKRLKPVPYYDTAGSAKAIAEGKVMNAGAIASCRAAKHYGLNVLAEEIEDSPNNYTRFIIIGNSVPKISEREKTSIIFSVRHVPGALYRALKAFADNGVNLTKIESRPTKEKPWEYFFFVDFMGQYDEKDVKNALDKLKKEALFIKVLGSYPAVSDN